MKSIQMLGVMLMAAVSAQGANWPQFRGPFFNGSTTEKDLPVNWSPTENIAWTARLPGPSGATPIVWNDYVFVSAADPDADELKALSFDRRTGRLRWAHTVAKGAGRTRRSNYASPTPVTDGQVVVFFYGNGELVAFDFGGKKLWHRSIHDDYGVFAFLWTPAASPLLYDGRLYLQVLQRDVPVDGRGFSDRMNESYLLAMNPKTGKTLWRQIRPSKARRESHESYTTPLPFERDGERSVMVIGGDALTAHDPTTGREQWRWETWNPEKITSWRHVPSPVASEDLILVCAPKRDPIYAIKTGGSGQLSDASVAWVSRDTREVSSDVPTPAYYDGDFFVLSDVRKSISRVEPKTGRVKWTVRTPGRAKYEASPLAADGKIHIINFDGQVVVFDADDGRVISTVAMNANGEYPIRSSLVAAGGQLFVRMNRTLYCVGRK